MKIIETNLNNFIEDTHTSKNGTFYFFKDFIVSEINQGAIINWETAQEIINMATDYYGENPQICYISNRINPYSINPIDWNIFFKSGKRLNGYAIVSYTENGWLNALIEKLFYNSKIARFKNLFEAISWVKEINYNATKNNT
ncbi:hypothetical protein [Lacinutrix cladophorae]